MPLFGNHRARRGGDRTRRALQFVASVVLAGSATIGPVAGPAFADTIVVIDGRGFGHGVGMAQDGAYWMGKSGRTANEILRLFYPGTTLVKQGGVVRVPLLSLGSVTIGFPNGGTIGDRRVTVGGHVTVRSTGGGLVADLARDVPAPATLTLRFAALHTGGAATELAQVEPQPGAFAETATTTPTPVVPVEPDVAIVLTPTTTMPPPSATTSEARQAAPSTAPIAGVAPASTEPVDPPSSIQPGTQPDGVAASTDPIGPESTTTTAAVVVVPKLRATAAPGGLVTIGSKRYRGTLELTATSSGIRIVNQLDVEDYLRGMGEIRSPDWPAATLQAQAIAARTYAFRTMATAGEVCPTQRCQVYLGAQAEYSQMDAAVVATRGKVLSYKGKLAATFYSASGGGTIATPAEAFGGNGTDLPYLTSGVYPTGDVKAWTVRMTLGEVGRRLGYPGAVASIQISRVGPSGRATEVTLDGSGGPVRLAGPRVDAALGLRSTFFTVRTEIGTLGNGPVDTGSADSAVDLGAQSGLLTAPDPAIGPVDATDADLDAADSTVDATTVESIGASPDTEPAPSVVDRAAEPRPTQTRPADINRLAVGAAHRDRGVELVLVGTVAAAVLASIALLRRLRSG